MKKVHWSFFLFHFQRYANVIILASSENKYEENIITRGEITYESKFFRYSFYFQYNYECHELFYTAPISHNLILSVIIGCPKWTPWQ